MSEPGHESPHRSKVDPLALAERVRDLVARERRMRPDQVRMSDRLEEDLGMTGDDASEFLEVFAREFAVDLEGIEFHRHFGPEGSGCLLFFAPPEWLQYHGQFPVTVDHLVRVAEMGRWVAPPWVAKRVK